MKWIIIVLVNYLPTSDQWDMVDYRHNEFNTMEMCQSYIDDNRRTFIEDANAMYHLDEIDFEIGCVSTDDFFNKILLEEALQI